MATRRSSSRSPPPEPRKLWSKFDQSHEDQEVTRVPSPKRGKKDRNTRKKTVPTPPPSVGIANEALDTSVESEDSAVDTPADDNNQPVNTPSASPVLPQTPQRRRRGPSKYFVILPQDSSEDGSTRAVESHEPLFGRNYMSRLFHSAGVASRRRRRSGGQPQISLGASGVVDCLSELIMHKASSEAFVRANASRRSTMRPVDIEEALYQAVLHYDPDLADDVLDYADKALKHLTKSTPKN